MCLGIPGRITALSDPADPSGRLAQVDVLGVRREINIACIVAPGEDPRGCIGAWVLVHVGFAMSRIDEHEAQLTLQLLKELGEAQEQAAVLSQEAQATAGGTP